jgi:hypothetical protein
MRSMQNKESAMKGTARMFSALLVGAAALLLLLSASPRPEGLGPAVQGQARLQPLARCPRALRGHEEARGRLPEVPQAPVHRQELQRAGHHAHDHQQPGDGPGDEQGGHVHRGQHPRQRDPGRRGLPVHDLVSHGELRPHRRHHPSGRRAGVLHHPHGQSRRPAVLHGGAGRQRPHGPRPRRRRQRRPVRRGPARGHQRQRRHRADPEVRPRPGHP